MDLSHIRDSDLVLLIHFVDDVSVVVLQLSLGTHRGQLLLLFLGYSRDSEDCGLSLGYDIHLVGVKMIEGGILTR